MHADTTGPAMEHHSSASLQPGNLLIRAAAVGMVAGVALYLLDNYLLFWRGWPGGGALLRGAALEGAALRLAQLQLAGYAAVLLAVLGYILATPRLPLRREAARIAAIAALLIRGAFWAVLLIGLVDMLISLLRIEGLLEGLVGSTINTELGRPTYRGTYVHLPLVLLGYVIALFSRALGFTWLTLLVVVAEFQIVLSRFVFSYEQAFMGDLVRFWYAALFLFASAHTLVLDGHVRVDVLYARFSVRGKAWANTLGCWLLGLPLCWVILTQGMGTKGDSINSPLLSFEISQSGYGMYVKYLMAGFLVVFAVSMIVQFMSYFLANAADLRGEAGGKTAPSAGH